MHRIGLNRIVLFDRLSPPALGLSVAILHRFPLSSVADGPNDEDGGKVSIATHALLGSGDQTNVAIEQ
jgi:hypothetical protein